MQLTEVSSLFFRSCGVGKLIRLCPINSTSLADSQLSHVWIDFRGIQDAFMRDKGIEYFENSRRATYVQQQYAIDNPLKFADYASCCWGITASEGPGPTVVKINGVERQFFDFVARGFLTVPTTARLRPGQWWHRCLSHPRSCCSRLTIVFTRPS